MYIPGRGDLFRVINVIKSFSAQKKLTKTQTRALLSPLRPDLIRRSATNHAVWSGGICMYDLCHALIVHGQDTCSIRIYVYSITMWLDIRVGNNGTGASCPR